MTLIANPFLADWNEAWSDAGPHCHPLIVPRGPNLHTIPSSIASAPVSFVDPRDGSKHPLRFVAGLFGVVQDEVSGALAPEFGWAVVHEPR